MIKGTKIQQLLIENALLRREAESLNEKINWATRVGVRYSEENHRLRGDLVMLNAEIFYNKYLTAKEQTVLNATNLETNQEKK